MTQNQWNDLLRIIKGEVLKPLPVGAIIDCPWLPGWYGSKIIDYFTNDEIWLDANLKAINTFPEVMFLPGFWSEYGMCTEPSAFGAKPCFFQDEFPHAHRVINAIEEIDNLQVPNPETDGLLPFVINRLKINRSKIEAAGHHIRFAVARGPLNIASYLMGTTDFLTTLMMDPDRGHLLIRKITDFLKSWIQLQIKTFDTIDGILLLDDLIGFISEDDFKEFGLPYFKELYDENVSVKFLHNDASCEASIKFYPEIGINLYNMAFDTDLNALKQITENKVTMLGNIPPRDVLAAGSPEDVKQATLKLLKGLDSKKNVLFSCGGGMPPKVNTENFRAMIDTVINYSE